MQDFDAIFAAVRRIPAGRVMSYGGVGIVAGAGARTVGWAMRSAPEDVPWQRVVAYDGYLPTVKLDPHLAQLQASILREEGVVLSEANCVEKRFFLDPTEL